jgi:PAS domain S-box-containing protein
MERSDFLIENIRSSGDELKNVIDVPEYEAELKREEKLRTDILNAFKEVVAFYSPDHNILWLNEAGKKQLNIYDDSYIGKKCYEVWFHADGPCQSCPVVSRKFETTERLLTLSGNRIWMVRHTPLFNEDSILEGFIEYRADITHISNLEKLILDEREKYKLLAENASFGLILTQDNRPVYVNKTFLDWFGFLTLADFEKSDIIELFHPNDRKHAEKLFRKIKNNSIPFPLVEKLRILSKDGKVRYFRVDVKNNSIDNQLFVQTVLVDITADVLKEKKQKQVAADALYMNQKNSILSEIENVLTRTLADKKDLKSGNEFGKIFDIIKSYKRLDKDWKMLIANFEEVHPGFFSRLKKAHPQLSSSDIKHCACIKMNFGTKEIARFFNIKVPSVQIARVRLKKKMDLPDTADLRGYILNF